MSSDPFFLPVKSGTKRKPSTNNSTASKSHSASNGTSTMNERRGRGGGRGGRGGSSSDQKKRKLVRDEESSDEEEDVFDPREEQMKARAKGKGKGEGKGSDHIGGVGEDEDQFADETADERRIRLAHEYLQKLERVVEEDDESDMADRLHQDAMEASGKRVRRVAEEVSKKLVNVDWTTNNRSYRGHRLPVTSLALAHDEATAFTSSKDGSIVRWNIESGKKETLVESEKEKSKRYSIMTLATDPEGRYLASGGTDNLIRIWDLRSSSLVQTFPGHRGTVAGLSFRQTGATQLFSSSFDRTVKVWNVEDMAYVETLYGHTSEVNCISSFNKERTTSGGRDTSVRLWKVVEETQLLFRGHIGSVDSICMINDDNALSGGEDGSLILWNAQKKRPVHMVPNAHGTTNSNPNWVSSVTACPNSDLLASGSCDGTIKVWRAQATSLSLISSIPAVGFVNGLAIGKSARFLVAGIAQEHRFGRWRRISNAKNGLLIVPFSSSSSSTTATLSSSSSSSYINKS